ncbi:unnamed protein product [Closterium sp. Naga37s-1]|nr:unnamed protein product [Closterium sp. Naga37s-1]
MLCRPIHTRSSRSLPAKYTCAHSLSSTVAASRLSTVIEVARRNAAGSMRPPVNAPLTLAGDPSPAPPALPPLPSSAFPTGSRERLRALLAEATANAPPAGDNARASAQTASVASADPCDAEGVSALAACSSVARGAHVKGGEARYSAADDAACIAGGVWERGATVEREREAMMEREARGAGDDDGSEVHMPWGWGAHGEGTTPLQHAGGLVPPQVADSRQPFGDAAIAAANPFARPPAPPRIASMPPAACAKRRAPSGSKSFAQRLAARAAAAGGDGSDGCEGGAEGGSARGMASVPTRLVTGAPASGPVCFLIAGGLSPAALLDSPVVPRSQPPASTAPRLEGGMGAQAGGGGDLKERMGGAEEGEGEHGGRRKRQRMEGGDEGGVTWSERGGKRGGTMGQENEGMGDGQGEGVQAVLALGLGGGAEGGWAHMGEGERMGAGRAREAVGVEAVVGGHVAVAGARPHHMALTAAYPHTHAARMLPCSDTSHAAAGSAIGGGDGGAQQGATGGVADDDVAVHAGAHGEAQTEARPGAAVGGEALLRQRVAQWQGNGDLPQAVQGMAGSEMHSWVLHNRAHGEEGARAQAGHAHGKDGAGWEVEGEEEASGKEDMEEGWTDGGGETEAVGAGAAAAGGAVDGYSWHKYGQTEARGERGACSYYQCTAPGCPAKKRVALAAHGHATHCQYHGRHCHAPPLPPAAGSAGSVGMGGEWSSGSGVQREGDLAHGCAAHADTGAAAEGVGQGRGEEERRGEEIERGREASAWEKEGRVGQSEEASRSRSSFEGGEGDAGVGRKAEGEATSKEQRKRYAGQALPCRCLPFLSLLARCKTHSLLASSVRQEMLLVQQQVVAPRLHMRAMLTALPCMALHTPCAALCLGPSHALPPLAMLACPTGDSSLPPAPHRRPEPFCGQRVQRGPKVVVRAVSAVELLDDGYRWRKYGQKLVHGRRFPREVVTTYEGKHSHAVPATRSACVFMALDGPGVFSLSSAGGEGDTAGPSSERGAAMSKKSGV